MSTHAYCRCNSGHFFQGTHCPFDGWSSTASTEINDAVIRLQDAADVVSIQALCWAGVSKPTLARTIVIEFGRDQSTFDALAPEGFVVNGVWQQTPALDAAHL